MVVVEGFEDVGGGGGGSLGRNKSLESERGDGFKRSAMVSLKFKRAAVLFPFLMLKLPWLVVVVFLSL